MLDPIFNYAALAIIFLVSFYLYKVLVSRILPKIFLKPSFSETQYDRGVRKCVFEEGRAVTYEPKLDIRKYISQYVLFEESGEKYIKCKINEKIKDICFDITVFDRTDKNIGTFEISQPVFDKGYTEAVGIPDETSYVSLNVKSVNGITLGKNVPCSYSGAGLMIYALLTITATALEGWLCSISLKTVFEILYYMSNGKNFDGSVNIAAMVAFSALLGLALAVAAIMINVPLNSKIIWSKNKTEKN